MKTDKEEEIKNMNAFEFEALKKDLLIVDENWTKEKGKSLCDQEFDVFLEIRVENDSQFNVFDVEPQEFTGNGMHTTQKPFDFTEDLGASHGSYQNQVPLEAEPDFEAINLDSDVNFSVEGASQPSQIKMLDNSADKYEVNSSISSFVPSNDGIFQESSFMIMDNKDKSIGEESMSSEMNVRRTMDRIKKLGNGSTNFIPKREKRNKFID